MAADGGQRQGKDGIYHHHVYLGHSYGKMLQGEPSDTQIKNCSVPDRLQPHGKCIKSSGWSHSTQNPLCPIPFTETLIAEGSVGFLPLPCALSPAPWPWGGLGQGCCPPSPVPLFCCCLLSRAPSSASKKFG